MSITLGIHNENREGWSLPMLADGTGPLQILETVSRGLKKPYSPNWFLDFPMGSALPFLLCAV